MTKTQPIDTILQGLIAKIEAGTMPWQQPWQSLDGMAPMPLRACGTPYKGINTLILWAAAMERDYRAATWLTFNAAREAGGMVRKGETGTKVVLWKPLPPKTEIINGVEMVDANSAAGVWRVYTVFNVEQCDGLPAKYTVPPATMDAPGACGPRVPARIDLDRAWQATGATITVEGDRAFYRPATDSITMPLRSLFADELDWHSTLAHELAHWTKHETRLDRSFPKHSALHAYALEELVAEIAAAVIGQTIGLPGRHMDDHAAYLANWLQALKANPRTLLSVASKAQAAAEYVLGLVEPALNAARAARLPVHAPGDVADQWQAIKTPSAPPVVVQIEAARAARTIKRAPQQTDLGPLFEPLQPGLFG